MELIDLLVIGIDTSGKTASCALCTEDAVLAQNTFVTKLTHSQVILPMVKKMLEDSGKKLEEIDGFAAVSGPGSYTGLRIGISAVKGICFALDKPCAGVSALESLAYNFSGTDTVICSVMHARQNLVYSAFFESDYLGNVERLSNDEIITVEELASRLNECARKGAVVCTGDYSAEAVKVADNEMVFRAAPLLNSPLASSLCFAAMKKGFSSPDELNAEYMQITKAEKDLIDKNKA